MWISFVFLLSSAQDAAKGAATASTDAIIDSVDPLAYEDLYIGDRSVQHPYGLTWGYGGYSPYEANEILRVSCGGTPTIPNFAPWNSNSGQCNPYKGDTPCSFFLPILCIKKQQYNRPCYHIHCSAHAMPKEFYCGWSEGLLALSDPVQGSSIGSRANADYICSKKLGPGWQMADHGDGKWIAGMDENNKCYSTWPGPHSGGGWSFYGYGVKGPMWTRFWVHITGQPGNCF